MNKPQTNRALHVTGEDLSPSPDPTPDNSHWMASLADDIEAFTGDAVQVEKTTIQPCVIDGQRAIVYEKFLHIDKPEVFRYLKAFARANGLRMQEDRRNNVTNVKYDRRKSLAPMLALGASMLLSGAQLAAADPSTPVSSTADIDTTSQGSGDIVYGTDNYLPVRSHGSRFMTTPQGESLSILKVAAEVREQGNKTRISSRGMTLPNPELNASIDRYDYQYPAVCGGQKFSYFEGKGFHALGYHKGDKVVMDVFVGGGPFTAPRLWGPFDQVLNDAVEFNLLMSNGSDDSFGLMKSSYYVGMVPDIDDTKRVSYGNAYSAATTRAADCTPQPSQNYAARTTPKKDA